jgi:hypothetical protein
MAGLRVVSVSNLANPVVLGGATNATGSAVSVRVSGRYAYVAYGDAGLQVFDVADPANVVRVGGLGVGGTGTALGLSLFGHYAVIAAGSAGLVVVDVNNPANPVEVGRYAPSYYAWDVHVEDDVVYVATLHNVVQMHSLANPANPLLIASVPMPGPGFGLAQNGDYLYAAGGDMGLTIFSKFPPPRLTILDNGASVNVSWPAGVTGFTLEMSDTLAPLQWNTAPTGTTNPAVIPSSGNTRFFRLRRP